ncbi:hypothetical protein Tco_1195288 [Tanacetum coccineum]
MLKRGVCLIESMQSFLMKYDHIPHNEKSIKLLLAEEKFLKIKQVVEEEQTQPEYLQELLQSLLTDLQILNRGCASFSDNSITRRYRDDHDSGEDHYLLLRFTLDDSKILPRTSHLLLMMSLGWLTEVNVFDET